MNAGRSTGQGADGADDARCADRRPIDRYGFVSDPDGRRLRGHRICEALAAFGGVELPRAIILDIGCSTGLITDEIAQRAAFAVGVDVDADSIDYARRNSRRACFALAAAAELPFADGWFDAAVCNHVYEHVPDAMALMREIRRVLRPGGACYFAGGHTLQLIEPHYRIPFLSWLPRPMASAWLRRLGRGDAYAEQFVAPWKLATERWGRT